VKTGLTSITFRNLSPAEIVRLVAEAGLDGIEWGGDVHVPPGDRETAREVRKMSEDTGITVSSYGSYYRLGQEEPGVFDRILETAEALAAPTIRVWAGDRGSAEAKPEYRLRIVEESRAIAEQALGAGMVVAFEFHGHTLTDTNASAFRLMQEVAHDNIRTYWQQMIGASVEERLEGLKMLMPWLDNIHCFHWVGPECERRALVEGGNEWSGYLSEAARSGWNGYVLLEYVKDDCPEAFREDAAALKRLIGN